MSELSRITGDEMRAKRKHVVTQLLPKLGINLNRNGSSSKARRKHERKKLIAAMGGL